MSDKFMTAAAAGALLLATTAFASAQQWAYPQDRYYGGWGYYGTPMYSYMVPPVLFAPGYYNYAPGYRAYSPGYYYDGSSWGYNGWGW
jgi:hypothetical protein